MRHPVRICFVGGRSGAVVCRLCRLCRRRSTPANPRCRLCGFLLSTTSAGLAAGQPATDSDRPPGPGKPPVAVAMPFFINDRYLDPDERAEVVSVKVAERRHLVCYEACDGEDREEEKKEDDDECPPLTDGCDLPGWRRERIAPCMEFQNEDVSQSFGGSLNIGASSVLMRRESQFPFSSAMSVRRGSKGCWWISAKGGIFGVPPPRERRAPEMEHHVAAELVRVDCNGKRREVTLFCKEYEIKNRPVKILGATQGWSAMPSYQKEGETGSSAKQDNRQDSTATSWVDVGCKSKQFSAGGSGGWT